MFWKRFSRSCLLLSFTRNADPYLDYWNQQVSLISQWFLLHLVCTMTQAWKRGVVLVKEGIHFLVLTDQELRKIFTNLSKWVNKITLSHNHGPYSDSPSRSMPNSVCKIMAPNCTSSFSLSISVFPFAVSFSASLIYLLWFSDNKFVIYG